MAPSRVRALWGGTYTGGGSVPTVRDNLSSIARLTPAGQFTHYTVPDKDEAWDLTNGPGGLWLTLIQGQFGGGGAIDQFAFPAR